MTTATAAEPLTTTPPPSTDAAPAAEPRRWHFTRDDLLDMYQRGMFRGHRVMLVDGEVLALSPMKPPHANSIVFVHEALRAAFGGAFTYRPQMPMDFGLTTDPEPDLAVVAGPPRSQPAGPPSTALLVVEVADTSLTYDTTHKANLYAAAGVADYWVLDVVNSRLHVFRDPRPDSSRRFGHGYFSHTLHGPDDAVAPLAAPTPTNIPVRDLLP